MMIAAMPLNIGWLRRFFKYQIEQYNNKDTDYLMFFAGRYRLKTTFYHKSVLDKPQRVPFEDTFLPVPEKYDEWLTQIFGDYMTPPPSDKRQGLHLLNVDFGKY